MRFQSAMPLHLLDEEAVGLWPRRPRRRARRHLADGDRARPTELVPVAHAQPPAAPSAGSWGPLTELSEYLRVQARRGHRAAVVPLQAGLFLVAEVREQSLRPEFGVLPLLAPLLTLAATRALKRREAHEAERSAAPRIVLPGTAPPAASPVRWAEPTDVQAVAGFGCPRCGR